MPAPHPFTDIERRLASPETTGMFVTMVAPDSPLRAAGLVPGDVIVSIDGAAAPPTRMEWFMSHRRTPDGPAVRRYEAIAADGTRKTVETPLPVRGVGACAVTAGVPAWDPDAPDDDEADISGLADGLGIYLRNSLEEEKAGYEVLHLRRRGGLLDVDVLFRLGGDDGQGGTWDYSTRAHATLRLERGLPAVATSFREGGVLVGDLRLEDGVWRGECDGPPGEGGSRARRPVEHPATADVCPAYISTLIPLTMPLRTGARVTWCASGDGRGIALARERFECTGLRTVKVDGADVEAWCFVQRHYGLDSYGGDETFWVTPDRRLVRVDWGPNYAGCRGESVPREHLNDGLPKHVRFEE